MAQEWEAPRRLREAQDLGRQIEVDHVLWSVYELPPPYFDRRSKPSLIFECETAVRRVRDYPADWRSLSDEELFSLSWRS